MDWPTDETGLAVVVVVVVAVETGLVLVELFPVIVLSRVESSWFWLTNELLKLAQLDSTPARLDEIPSNQRHPISQSTPSNQPISASQPINASQSGQTADLNGRLGQQRQSS